MVRNLSERRREELASEVRSFCRIFELPVDHVIASTPVLAIGSAREPGRKTNLTWSLVQYSLGLRTALDPTGILQTKFAGCFVGEL
jgi:hypothetical protein